MRPGTPIAVPSASAVNRAGSPLFHAAWLFVAGIVLSHALWLRPAIVLIAILAMIAVCAAAALIAPRLRWLSLAFLWLLLGLWCAELEPFPAPAPTLLHASDGLLRTAEGIVTDAGLPHAETSQIAYEPSTEQLTQRIDLSLTSLEIVNDATDAQQPMTGGIRLPVRWPQTQSGALSDATTFHCGERVRALVRLEPPEVYRDPGAWSRAAYLLNQGITSTASVSIDRIEHLGPAPGQFLKCRLSQWQHASTLKLMSLPAAMSKFPPQLRLTEEDTILLAAMITGDRTLLSKSLRAGFERTGSFHMLVVSGLHLAIIAGFLFALLRRLRIPNIPATLITLAASCGYAFLTGFAQPVQRSLWMVSLYYIGRLLFRERSALNTIGFAALVMLVASPRSLFDAGFEMTLLAVVAIAGIAMPILRATIEPYRAAALDLRRTATDAKLPPPVAQYRIILRTFAESLAAAVSRRLGWDIFPWLVRAALRIVELIVTGAVVELAMTLPMAAYFHRITIFALPVNMLIVPFLALLVPLALITWIALLIAPSFASFPAAAVALLLHAGVGIVRKFGSLSIGDFRIASPLAWQIAAFCALLALAVLLAHRGPHFGPWLRRAAWAALICAALAAVAPRPTDHPHNALLIEAIDVGQGDSLLVITPDGKTLLVDGGGFGGGLTHATQPFDIGEEIVSQVLWSRGIHHLDTVALSHAHADHLSGLPSVLRNFHPDALWVGNNPHSEDYDALIAEAAELRIPVRALHAGDTLLLGAAQIRVLAPTADYQPGVEPSNNDSLVLRIASGNASALLTGDAEGPVEHAMMSEPDFSSTLLKVGHHGSVTSTHKPFLARVAPQWAIISCGLRNHYGHPREEILAELERAGIRTMSTDINGASCFSLDGKTVTASSDCGINSNP